MRANLICSLIEGEEIGRKGGNPLDVHFFHFPQCSNAEGFLLWNSNIFLKYTNLH